MPGAASSSARKASPSIQIWTRLSDPQILERGSKAPVVQLDLWMAGEEWCKQQIYRAVTEGKADFV
ncbi:hypothetical protein QTG54_012378 [Skeletonema marinoi]|uniref:Uncharacterized protein n=1 Tax=Skeletonema marinoi TaxID=267567 RepID=A0AAD9D8U2_9STRA|nr:hypothetical protein QTG54_012378 [Skeletonema marinoi]